MSSQHEILSASSQKDLDIAWLNQHVSREICIDYAEDGYKKFGRGTVVLHELSEEERKSKEKSLFTHYVPLDQLKPLEQTGDPTLVAMIEKVLNYNPNKELVLTLKRPDGLTTYLESTARDYKLQAKDAFSQKILVEIDVPEFITQVPWVNKYLRNWSQKQNS